MKTITNYELRIKNGGGFSFLLFVFLSFYLLVISLKGQSTSENYIYVQEPKEAVSTVSPGTDAIRTVQYFDGLGRPKQAIQVKASPDQSGGTSHKNLVVKTKYDCFGRQVLDYLPVPVSQSGLSYISETTVDNAYNTFYDSNPYNTDVFFSEKTIENSPLNRVMKQAAPGDDWAEGGGHEIEFQYLTNTASEVRIYWVDGSGTLKRENYNGDSSKDYYEAGTLYKTVTTDENGQKIYEYKNKQGQVVMKRARVAAGSTAGKNTNPDNEALLNADTYYVYDVYGNLAYVVPPLASARSSLTATYINSLCYQYKYDERNRLVEKQLPGKGREYMVYDRQDRLVATQDANLKDNWGSWLFTKYDKFSRVVYTGMYSSTASRTSLQATVNGFGSNNESRNDTGFTQNGISIKYTKTAFPTSIAEVLTVNYYDYYGNIGFTAPSSVLGEAGIRSGTQTADAANSLKGLQVGTLVRIPGSDNWESIFTVYDNRTRPVQTYKHNHLGGYTQTSSLLNFRGLPTKTETVHKRASTTPSQNIVTVTEYFTYDNMERLQKHTHQINGGAQQLIALNSYDKLGQLTGKKVGGTASNALDRWQDIEYKYNIRGWLTDINNVSLPYTGKPGDPGEPMDNDDLFSFRITYNNVLNSAAISPLYNGNIAQTFWKTAGDNIQRGYDYTYDQLNRLRKADFYKESTNPYTGSYGEYLAYDLNGNILNLVRYTGDATNNQIDMDDLSYTYQSGSGGSNRLMRVEDATSTYDNNGFQNGNTGSDDYAYDGNGNMTRDRNKDITEITYNYMNLPEHIYFGNGNGIEYFYNAAGQKIQKKVYDTTNNTIKEVDYLDGFQYTGGVLNFFPHSEGYVSATESGVLTNPILYNYVYNYTDHLGNIRLSYTKDPVSGDLEIMEENNYYPFGLKHSVYSDPKQKYELVENEGESMARPTHVYQTDYQYKYNGKEFQDELGLNWYDYGARMYMPDIARWGQIDPLAAKAFSLTPYRYSFNNPVKFIDPDGVYETDGHFWTVYLMSTLMGQGQQTSYTIAYYTEAPDNIIAENGEVLSSPMTWMNVDSQWSTHALNGGKSPYVRAYAASRVRNSKTLIELGNSLHYLGDSYAHSIIGNEGRMYENGLGHLFSGHTPDKISERPELYLKYVNALKNSLSNNVGFNGNVDLFTFNYIADSGGSTEQNSAVFETEVRILEGASSFSTSGNQIKTINDYLSSRNCHYGSDVKANVIYTSVDVYSRNEKGDWEKKTEKRTFVKFNN